MTAEKHISRNAPCPCGSGNKYKKCCGNLAHSSGVASETDARAKPSAQQMYTEAMNLCNSGRYKEAKEIYEELVRTRPNEVRAVSGLWLCLAELGQSERALEMARRALKLEPDNFTFINEFIVMLFNAGKVEESLEWAKRAVKMGPEGAKSNVFVANCYEKLHRIDDALEANRLAQIASPQTKYLKFQEAKLVARNGEYERASEILRETSQAPGLPPELKAQIFGELGRVLDKLKDYDQAYEAFSQSGHAAASSPKIQKFNLGYRPGLISAYIKGLTEERLKKWKPEDLKDDSWTPAFLVGFPRSGTTMTEQIMAAHSSICTTDEQPYMEHVRMEWARIVGANPDLGWMADQLDVDDILQLRKIYREKVEADQKSPIGSNIVIDKLPLNIMNIGLINLVFPEAKIIVALRDPRDCCLSSFMQDFELNSAMIHFLALDRAVNFYTQVMGAWLHFRDIISLSHFTIRYEDTVQNLEFEAKLLIDYLGLDWEPDLLQFYHRARERVIATPSYVAVTEPVHTRAIGRWKNYHQQFAPLLPKLEPFIREFGYEIDG
jgi:tetratricopeptide (TPR) repeat protein